ncbi:unnamed protein product [Rhizoctonia solani]|uniref:F-box domain-containing protein n=1 Tax=Rhizoctonia solani TaxID=456999 RepID=A0A8H3D3N1_9AGAM|nr:unnamed protein product [Rhizoctonia solani]
MSTTTQNDSRHESNIERDTDTNEEHNKAQLINQLPIEVLASIFHIVKDMQGDLQSYRSTLIQEIVLQVCAHWRNVALATPILWRHIYISHPPPHPKAQLYISRSGNCSLDIQMEMKASYLEPEDELFFDSGRQAERALQTLQLIVEYGGTMDRWRSLIIRSKAARPLYDAIGLINSAPTPALRFLSFTWGGDDRNRALSLVNSPRVQAMRDAEGKTGDSYSLAHSSRRPQLAHVELVRLPSQFVFLRSSPMVSNLTRFKLASPFPSLQSVSNLLSGTPCLELLDVDIGNLSLENARERLNPTSLDRLRISLPLLSVFSLKIWQYQICGLQLLKIINAPNVESFELEFEIDHGDAGYLGDDRNWSIPAYLAKGRVHGALQSLTSPARNVKCGPIFPLAHKLNIKHISSTGGTFGQPTKYHALASAFPNITHLAASHQCIDVMLGDPNAHPNLTHIALQTPNHKDIRKSLEIIAEYAFARQRLGSPISTLHIYTETPESYFKALKPKADNLEVIDAILERDEWRSEESITILYSVVDALIVREPELRSPNWLMDSDYAEPKAAADTDIGRETGNTESEGSGSEGETDSEPSGEPGSQSESEGDRE